PHLSTPSLHDALPIFLERHFHVLGTEPGHRGFDQELSIGLPDIHRKISDLVSVAPRRFRRKRLEQLIHLIVQVKQFAPWTPTNQDRKSTRLNSSHQII